MKASTFIRSLRLLAAPPGSRLLDVGCAQGEFAQAAVSLGMKVTGIDLNPQAIAVARERVPSAEFICGELTLSTVPGGLDAITMFDFIEHVRDPVETLGRAARLLKPSGQLLISTPRVGSGVHHATGRFWPQYREEHLVLFSLRGLRIALGRARLTPVQVVPTVKYVSPSYLLGQAAEYGGPLLHFVSSAARPLTRTKLASLLLPLRFGEITVVAKPIE